jgi:hypothetical protein
MQSAPACASRGNHRRSGVEEAPGRPPFTFAFHDKVTIPASLVRTILTKDIGLVEDEARKLL